PLAGQTIRTCVGGAAVGGDPCGGALRSAAPAPSAEKPGANATTNATDERTVMALEIVPGWCVVPADPRPRPRRRNPRSARTAGPARHARVSANRRDEATERGRRNPAPRIPERAWRGQPAPPARTMQPHTGDSDRA